MTSSTPEGLSVPPAAIPAAAWGISGRALTAGELAAQDPFEGDGLRLDGLPGRELTTDDVHEGTGLSEVIVLGGSVIWVRLGPDDDGAAVVSRWHAWLAQEEVTDST